ncbi:MAG: glycogen synthase GlgA [Bacilli bacterium]|jgi:starch synthase
MKRILFAVAECQPFIATGGLAEVAGSLPKAIMASNTNYKVEVIMPLYRGILEKYGKKLKFLGKSQIQLAWRKLYCGLFRMVYEGVTYYFIDNKYYFDRDNIYGHYDDGERFAFFSKSVIDVLPLLTNQPDVIHTHDWHTALVNIFLDILYKKEGKYMDIKSVFTIHNIEYQGRFGEHILEDVFGISKKYTDLLMYNGDINLVKGAIVCSDLITTVSPRYAREIALSQYACGLEYIIRLNSSKIVGIINGINTEFYNPMTDQSINANFDIDSIEKRKENKKALQMGLDLEVNDDICIISIISRLASHKGIDLILDKFHEIMLDNVQVIILGKGDYYYEQRFQEMARFYPKRVSALITYDMDLSKRIYSGSDLFLMPSKMEPCGLSQMIASRYGCVPIVRATGGLFDTIKDYSEKDGNGFVFKDYDSSQMLAKITEAVGVFNKKEDFKKLIKKAMSVDFSWNRSSKEYIAKYNELLKKKGAK